MRNGRSLTIVVKISVTHRRENVISLQAAASAGGRDEQLNNASAAAECETGWPPVSVCLDSL